MSGTTALALPSPVTVTDVKAPFVPQSLTDPVKWWDKSAHLVSSIELILIKISIKQNKNRTASYKEAQVVGGTGTTRCS